MRCVGVRRTYWLVGLLPGIARGRYRVWSG